MSTGIQLKYNSITHFCLKYAKVADVRDSFTAEDVKHMFTHKGYKVSKITRSLELLTDYRMLRKVVGGYKITEAGKQQLRSMAKKGVSGDE